MNKMFVLIVVCIVAGCQKPAPVVPGTLTSDAVTDNNTFRSFYKVWHLQITDDVQMNVTSTLQPWLEKCDWTGCGKFALNFSDQLKQGDGAWVDFNCDKVAEKIIDRDLVPKVESACHSVHQAVIDYWKQHNDPTEFTDHEGRVWRRQ